MATINIPSYHDDPNYRYKMPKLKAKIEGRGNGIKTNIVNMGDIARALKRPPEYPTRFCGCELGSSSKFEPAEGKAIVNGAHTEADLQTIIDKFIERFVLCPNCKLPEADLLVSKGRVKGKCNACGFSGDMDNTHKVGTFILKNPPGGTDSTMGKKASKKAQRAERTSKKTDREDDDVAASDLSRTSEAAPKKPKKDKEEKKEKREKSKKEDDEKPKKDEKKVKDDKKPKDEKRKKDKKKRDEEQEEEETGPIQLTHDSEEVVATIQRLKHFLGKEGENKPTPNDVFQEVRLLQVAQDFSAAIRVYVTISALFEDRVSMDAEAVKEKLPIIAAVCDRSVDGTMILEAFEQLFIRKFPDFDKYAFICSELYHGDLVDEEAFLKRYSVKSSVSEPHAKAKDASTQFIKWLEEAESATESESENSDV